MWKNDKEKFIVLLDSLEYKNKVSKFLEQNVNFSKLDNSQLDKFIRNVKKVIKMEREVLKNKFKITRRAQINI